MRHKLESEFKSQGFSINKPDDNYTTDKDGNESSGTLSIKNEYTIPTILRVAKKSDKDRLSRRTNYSNFKLTRYDFDRSNLVLYFKVGSYKVTLVFIDFYLYYNYYYSAKPDDKKAALSKTFDWLYKNGDVEVDCECSDFKYRYAYVSSVHGMKAGKPELRPANKTNPKGKGRVCKHILAVLNRPSNYKRVLINDLARNL